MIHKLTENSESFVTSPVSVYQLSSGLKATNCDEYGVCRLKFTFQWLNPEAVCMSNFVCSKLEGPICKEYGIRFHQVTREGIVITNESVCEPGLIVGGTIGAGQLGMVELWYQQNFPMFNADCYFWCTSDGNLPKQSKTPVDYNLVSYYLPAKHHYFLFCALSHPILIIFNGLE